MGQKAKSLVRTSQESESTSVPAASTKAPPDLVSPSDMEDETRLYQRMTARLTAEFPSDHRYTEEIDAATDGASPALRAESTFELSSSSFTLTR